MKSTKGRYYWRRTIMLQIKESPISNNLSLSKQIVVLVSFFMHIFMESLRCGDFFNVKTQKGVPP